MGMGRNGRKSSGREGGEVSGSGRNEERERKGEMR